uniref:Uncharacterized protein n=1 Tax=Octopus bimaculoides TaxID=37653 RepID=A0A0L8FVQ8_OCTBM
MLSFVSYHHFYHESVAMEEVVILNIFYFRHTSPLIPQYLKYITSQDIISKERERVRGESKSNCYCLFGVP